MQAMTIPAGMLGGPALSGVGFAAPTAASEVSRVATHLGASPLVSTALGAGAGIALGGMAGGFSGKPVQEQYDAAAAAQRERGANQMFRLLRPSKNNPGLHEDLLTAAPEFQGIMATPPPAKDFTAALADRLDAAKTAYGKNKIEPVVAANKGTQIPTGPLVQAMRGAASRGTGIVFPSQAADIADLEERVGTPPNLPFSTVSDMLHKDLNAQSLADTGERLGPAPRAARTALADASRRALDQADRSGSPVPFSQLQQHYGALRNAAEQTAGRRVYSQLRPTRLNALERIIHPYMFVRADEAPFIGGSLRAEALKDLLGRDFNAQMRGAAAKLGTPMYNELASAPGAASRFGSFLGGGAPEIPPLSPPFTEPRLGAGSGAPLQLPPEQFVTGTQYGGPSSLRRPLALPPQAAAERGLPPINPRPGGVIPAGPVTPPAASAFAPDIARGFTRTEGTPVQTPVRPAAPVRGLLEARNPVLSPIEVPRAVITESPVKLSNVTPPWEGQRIPSEEELRRTVTSHSLPLQGDVLRPSRSKSLLDFIHGPERVTKRSGPGASLPGDVHQFTPEERELHVAVEEALRAIPERGPLGAIHLAPNASGESKASLEALNRARNMQLRGEHIVSVDTRSGIERPLIGVTAPNDAEHPSPYEVTYRVGPNGREQIAAGAKARMLPPSRR